MFTCQEKTENSNILYYLSSTMHLVMYCTDILKVTVPFELTAKLHM